MEQDNSTVLDFISSEITGLYKFMKVLGISKRELEIYSLILTSGGLTANEISEILGIPTSKVYEALSSLIDRKWVYRTTDRPARYFSIPVRDLWEDIKTTMEKQIQEVEEKIIPLLEKISASPIPLFKVVLIDSARIPVFIKRILTRSMNDIYLAISYSELLDEDILEKLKIAGMTKNVRVILTKELEEVSKKMDPLEIEYKIVDKLFGSGIIGDEILLIVKSATVLNALWSDHAYFIDLGKIYFKYIWENSQ